MRPFKVEKLPSEAIMEQYNNVVRDTRSEIDKVFEVQKQATFAFVNAATAFWYEQMEAFLQEHIVSLYGMECLPEVELQYQGFNIPGEVLDKNGERAPMIAETKLFFRGVFLYRITLTLVDDKLIFETTPQSFEENPN